MGNDESDIRKCSFCGKLETEVQALIVAHNANICNECVCLCHEELKEQGISLNESKD